MPRTNKKLEKLLDERQAVEAEGRTFNAELFNTIRTELQKWDSPNDPSKSDLDNYHPLVELAKFAVSPSLDESLRAKCNMEIASYMYPKVKSFEIKSKEDKTVNVNINIAGYARSRRSDSEKGSSNSQEADEAVIIEPEQIELSGEREARDIDDILKRVIN